jgi:dihydrofolate reductase
MINIIAAISENNVIGKDNQLLWNLPRDMQHFRKLTTGHPIIMGRKTYESIGRPLPNRTNIVVSRNPDFVAPEGCIAATSLLNAIGKAKEIDSEIFIIGGGEIYKHALYQGMVDKIYLTIIHHIFDGDTEMPHIPAEWESIKTEYCPADEKNQYGMTFMELVRN